jgi:hypothetical protein
MNFFKEKTQIRKMDKDHQMNFKIHENHFIL